MSSYPNFKKFLSYFIEIQLEKTQSQYNPEIIVSLHKGRYKLSTSNAVYSFEDLYYCFSQAFDLVEIDKVRPEKVLILGYGLGSIKAILEKTYGVHAEITGIEIDPEIIRLNRTYGYQQSDLKLVESDAVKFMEENEAQFDLINIDVFSDHRVPVELDDKKFLENISKALRPGGMVIFNRMHDDESNQKQNKRFKEVFTQVFPYFQLYPVRQNLMHVGYKKA